MANETIPNLPAATSLTGSEQFWAVQNGQDVKVSTTQIVGFGGLGSTVEVPSGGTGVTEIQNNALVIGQGTNPIATITPGTTGQFLTAQTNGAPQWSTFVPGASVSNITFGSTGLTPSSPTSGSVSVGGVLNVASGGTGVTTLTGNALICGNGTSGVTQSMVGAQGQILIGSSTVPAWLAAGTAGQILQTNGSGSDPSWVNLPGTGVATISFGSTGLTPSTATAGAVTVTGTLGTAHGGTGLTSFTSGAAVYASAANALTTGTLPTTGGGTGLASFTSGGAVYATSTSALTTGTLPIASGGTGATSATGTGNPVLATGATIASATLTNPTITGASLNGLNGGAFGLRNILINGGMMIDQRNRGGTQTFTAGSDVAYCVDQWFVYCAGANVTGHQTGSSGASAPGSPAVNAYQITGAASVTGVWFGTRVSSFDSAHLAGSTATLSVNISCSTLTSVTWTAYYASTGNNFGTVASPNVTSIASGVFAVSSTMTRYSTQISIPSLAFTGLQIVFSVGALTSGTLTFANAQLEPGGVATPFERLSQGLVADQCLYYYQPLAGRLYVSGTSFTSYAGAETSIPIAPMFRATPTIATPTIVSSSGGWVGTTVNTANLTISSTTIAVSFWPGSTQNTAGAQAIFNSSASAVL